MRFKSLTNDQTVPRYRYFNFYKLHKVNGKGFFSQMPTLKTVPSDQKSNRRTCAEECQKPHYESEAKCKAFHMKISFIHMQTKLIFESLYRKIHTFELRKKE